MANTNAPRGLIPVSNAYGAPWSGATRQYLHAVGDGVAIFVGDLVTATGTSVQVNVGGTLQSFPIVAQSATGDVFQGVCTGVAIVTRDSPVYAPASTQVIINVCDDPNALFLIQDVSTGTPLNSNDIELNCNIVVGSGSTTTGFSAMTLDNTTEQTTNTLDVKLLGQYQSPNNDIGSSVSSGTASGLWVVRLNRHRFANQVAGV